MQRNYTLLISGSMHWKNNLQFTVFETKHLHFHNGGHWSQKFNDTSSKHTKL